MMSWDIFLQAHEDGGFGYFPLSVVFESFGTAITYSNIEGNECCIILEYQNQDAEIYIEIELIDNIQMLSSFSVNRPPGHDDFWQGLCNILKITSSALFWGGDGNCLAVGREETIKHLPESMIEALGAPTVVSNYQDIFRMIRS
ncbi:hypothetical protein F6Q07_04070 [Pectobacterium parmentieri]|uniref:Integron gene cassette protein n=2 Tax=Pectobacterium parmentieri TaxID=1905730 RepID=A0A0H3I675_PECPM|nr:hypothetical protein [Pectobacterium parmentieri]AFI91052.1 Putative integron gene cassette protein [Pectobacterium parmentieri]AOR58020.1 hypothetical protein A8F97_03750 [Pectobacterium parmentieri]AYH02144.1 hypothetical protein C5E26_15005 [Pectobacterium parmentieri]AYH06407.1 hypothetical protein C5E25_14145 [Pectobacterium parmentieri]AYH10963.1 hypothetical protein C5E24_15350 [Pectobacterium parmentieri]